MPDETLPPDLPRAVRIVCPNCGVGIQVVVADPGDVSCPSCGSVLPLTGDAVTQGGPATGGDTVPSKVGRFEVVARLGAGAFGTVYKARDPALHRVVAIKVPRAGAFPTRTDEDRFRREARAAAQLQHPGIVTVYEVGDDPPLIASEFVDGPTLADRLAAGRPTVRESVELVAGVADALDYAHRTGIVHRDVKPANILLDAAGKPHLTDFGLARRDDPEFAVTLDGAVVGTPAYMAPEQAAGTAGVDGRADTYALGVVLYELLTGTRPFRGGTRPLLQQVLHDDPRPPRRLNGNIPRDLETVCLKCLEKDPGKRYPSAGELGADLRRWQDGRPVLARRAGRAERLARWCRRNPTVAGLSVAVAAVFLVGAAVSVWYAVNYRRTAGKLDEAVGETAEVAGRLDTARLDADRREAARSLDRAQAECEGGNAKAGLIRLARGLETLERLGGAPDDTAYARLALSLWGQALAPRRVHLPEDADSTFVHFLPDDRTYLAITPAGIGRYDIGTGRPARGYTVAALRPRVAEGHRDYRELVVAADGSAFRTSERLPAAGDKDKLVDAHRVWDAETGRLLADFPVEVSNPKDRPAQPLWDAGLRRVAFWPSEGAPRTPVCDARSGRKVADLDLGGLPDELGAEFSRDGRRLVAKSADGDSLQTWDVDAGRRLSLIRIAKPRSRRTWDMSIRPDGSEGVTVRDDGEVQRWDLTTGRAVGDPIRLPGKRDAELAARTSPDGRWLVLSQGGVAGGFGGRGFGGEIIGLGGGVAAPRFLAAWEWNGGRAWPHADVEPGGVSPDGQVGLTVRPRRLIDLQAGAGIGPPLPEGAQLVGYTSDSRLMVVSQGPKVLVFETRSGRRVGPAVLAEQTKLDRVRGQFIALADDPDDPDDTDDFIQLWRLSPVEGSAERVTLWAQVLTGMELDADGATRALSPDEVADRKQRLDALGGDPLPK